MTPRQKRRIAAAALALAAVGGAPYVSADRLSPLIRAAVEASLHRKVELGEVRLHLITGPAFTVKDVRIYDDPAFGIEPVAYVTTLYARPRLRSLWSGKLEFGALKLDDPSLNLVRTEAGRWNFEPLVAGAGLSSLPRIEVTGGRINFKFGETKSLFYLTSADLEILPPSAGADGRIRFAGEPSRADRPARGLGSIVASGRWKTAPGGSTTAEASLQLEKTALGEIVTLVRGRDAGIHGLITSRVEIRGPLEDLSVTGRIELQDVRRWDFPPARGAAWPLRFRGRLDLPGQEAAFETLGAGAQPAPLSLRLHAANFLSAPRWGATLTAEKFPVAPLVGVLRNLGAALPERLKLEGALDGAIGYSSGVGWRGGALLREAGATAGEAAPARFERALVTLDRDRLTLSLGNEPRIEADYRIGTQSLDLSISSAGMALAPLHAHASIAAVPLFEQIGAGIWQGRLRYQREGEGPGTWSGRGQLKDAEVTPPGMSAPLRIESVSLQLQGGRVVLDKLRLSAGAIRGEGEYRYEPRLTRPHRFKLRLGAANAAELESLAAATLRREAGFLARTLGIGRAPVPEWLATRHMDGSIEIDSLQLAGGRFEDASARLLWDGARVELVGLKARWEGASLAGRASADLSGAVPAYDAALSVKGLPWMDGTLDADTRVRASGASLRAEGSFRARDVSLDASASLSGCFLVEWPRVRFTEIVADTAAGPFIGSGALQEDGKLSGALSNAAKKELRLAGTLSEPRFE